MSVCSSCLSNDTHAPTCHLIGKVLAPKEFMVPLKWSPNPQLYPTEAVQLSTFYKCSGCGATGMGDHTWVSTKVKRCSATGISGIHLWEGANKTAPPSDMMPDYPAFQTYGYEGKPKGDWRQVR